MKEREREREKEREKGGGESESEKKRNKNKVNAHVLVQCNKMHNLTRRCKIEFLITYSPSLPTDW